MRARAELAGLDDRMLRDIGLTRADVCETAGTTCIVSLSRRGNAISASEDNNATVDARGDVARTGGLPD